GKPEPSEPNGHGNVKGHRTSRVAQTESLVSDVSRVDGSAHGPRAPSPKQIHSVRCRRSGEKAEYDTNGGVCQAGEQCRSEPASVDRFSCTLNRLTHCRLVSVNPRPSHSRCISTKSKQKKGEGEHQRGNHRRSD